MVLLVWTAVVFGAGPQVPGAGGGSQATKGDSTFNAFRSVPMTITSERLTIHDAQRQATFEGSVVVKQGDLTLHADRIDVWTVDSPSAMEGMMYGGSNVSVIKAFGHVELTQEDRFVRADQAVYTQATQQIELMGNLSGHEGSGYKVSGTHMVIFLLEHRSVIDKSHVVIAPETLSTIPSAPAAPQQP
jgi:lipopolysaccharide transport protein LptA